MPIEISLLSQPISLDLPPDWIGWLGLLVLGVLNVIILVQWRGFNKRWSTKKVGGFILLSILVPITSLFLFIRLPVLGALPPTGIPVDPSGPALVVFMALPWVLAAGFMGPLPAAVLAFFSGCILALWDTHSLFTPLQLAFLAACMGVCVQQRFHGLFFRILRRPLFTAVCLTLVFPLIFLFSACFDVSGTLPSRLDYALTHTWMTSLAVGGALFVAGLFGEGVAVSLPGYWGIQVALQPSPFEKRLHTRFLANMSPLAVALVITLMAGDWVVAGSAARQMLQRQMASTAQIAAETIPFFLETGQNLIQQLATNPQLVNIDPAQLPDVLKIQLRSVPFFTQLFLMDQNGNPVAGYPVSDYNNSNPSREELLGIESANNGVAIQFYALPPQGETASRVTFLARLTDELGNSRGVLIGRTDLASNPFTQPVLKALQGLAAMDGDGMLLDESGRVLYHSNPNRWFETYSKPISSEASFFDDTAPDGTRRLVYTRPTLGNPWAIVITIPARQAQQLALTIAAPMLVIILVLFLMAAVLLRLGLRAVTASLENLAWEADRIAGGSLEHPLQLQGVDEIGQLRKSFEQMRVSLKARMEELNRLLLASKGITASTEMQIAVKPVMDAAQYTGAAAVRIVLEPGIVPESEHNASNRRFGNSPASSIYTYLDDQILEMLRHRDRLVLSSMNRVRDFTFIPGAPRPESLLALPLKYENRYFGALFLIFESPHHFTEDEVRFLTTLSGQAALAVTNASLYMTAAADRQRLAAILDSTPEPVIVTDDQNRLIRANPAACQAVGFSAETSQGQPIEQITSQKELIQLLSYSTEPHQSIEMTLSDGKVYLATASSVVGQDEHPIGRVCVLRDVTHFKELDSLKSEFVSTVSHDLRSPLTLMRGYATMLEMVGNLNDQQTGYVRKIVTSVETMSRLVNNLLDLGRIEAGIDLQLEMVPIADITDRVIGALQLQAGQKRIQLTSEIAPDTVPLLEADQALLQQALYNLVENAVKYTDSGGRIIVRLQTRQDRTIFEVQDSGIGIAPVDQPRLFEKFYRGAQREARKQTGSGLGLAIVKSIADRHNGQVRVESQLGKGSTFSIAIPLQQPNKSRM